MTRYGYTLLCEQASPNQLVADAERAERYGQAPLPDPAAFAAATRFVREDDVAAVSCGPDLDQHLASVARFQDAGFTDIALVQVGGRVSRVRGR